MSTHTVFENYLVREATGALRHGNEDAQYLACLMLRYLGHECWGNDYGYRFHWTLDGERIHPDTTPLAPPEPMTWISAPTTKEIDFDQPLR